MARIIINSDDFAISKEVNNSIATSFKQGLISSTTALVNYEEALCHAARLVKKKNIPEDAVGIHLNLTEGYPLSLEILDCNEFCVNGRFHGRIREKPIFTLDKDKLTIVQKELELQFEKFVRTFGFFPSHIDGHHHIHTEWAIIRVVMKIAKKYQIKPIRISRNTGSNISHLKMFYKRLFKLRLRLNGFKTTHLFGDICDFLVSGIKQDAISEIMVHSRPSEKEYVVNDLDGKDLKNKLSKLIGNNSITLINYNQI